MSDQFCVWSDTMEDQCYNCLCCMCMCVVKKYLLNVAFIYIFMCMFTFPMENVLGC